MTKKEKLANEYVELKKQFDGENFKAGLLQNQVAWLTRTGKFTVTDLEDKIQAVRRALEEKKKREEREAWFQTEEGKAYRQEREDAIKIISNQMRELYLSAYDYTRKVIKNLLGNAWDVTSFSSSGMEIAIVKEYSESGQPKAIFGHDFDISFGKMFFDSKFCWTMNYGTLGSFEIDDDEERKELLVGMAKFVSDTECIPNLRVYLQEFSKRYDKLFSERYAIERKLRTDA